MTTLPEGVLRAWKRILRLEDGKIVLAHLLVNAGLFRRLETVEELAVENFFKGLLGELELYTDGGVFPLDYVKKIVPPYEEGDLNE